MAYLIARYSYVSSENRKYAAPAFTSPPSKRLYIKEGTRKSTFVYTNFQGDDRAWQKLSTKEQKKHIVKPFKYQTKILNLSLTRCYEIAEDWGGSVIPKI